MPAHQVRAGEGLCGVLCAAPGRAQGARRLRPLAQLSCRHGHTVAAMVAQLPPWSHSCRHGHTVAAM
eukprot:213003-Chlamydomonas_euryale.AAC.2